MIIQAPNHSSEQPQNGEVSPTTLETILASADAKAEYIRTNDAAALLGALDKANLRLSDDAIRKLQHEQDSLHGNAYAWMTRSVATWIADGTSESGSTLFEQAEPQQLSDIGRFVTPPLENIEELAVTGSPGADLLIDLIKQTAIAKETGAIVSDIPVSASARSLKRASCKDVEVYFAQAANGYAGPDALKTITIGNRQFWHKSHGAPTYINLEEVAYNGIALPAGCVFRKEEDGGYLFTRVTGLAFDQSTAEEVFGHSITDWYSTNTGENDMRHLFAQFKTAKERI